ncbi:bacterio-opsin activator domain-containing protein [Natronomonas amylolytica]|uniref:bacterio-opsin activator domain-containing protein n=1 Tax=Natronomonas amylolytica TaxID=3108498 RepID=UPI003009F5AA
MGRTHGDDAADGSTAGEGGEPVAEVFDRLTDAVFALDREGRFTYVNDPAERVLGESEAELLGTVAWEAFSGNRREQFEQHCAEALRTQESTSFEEFDPTVETWYDVGVHPSETGVSVHFRDITERREAQQALHERERQLSTLMSNVPGMVYRCRDEEGWPMEFVGEGCADLTGYDPDVIEDGVVEWADEVVVEADRGGHREEILNRVERRESFSVTYRIRRADGEVRWVRERGRGVFEDGDLVGLEGVITDVTERVEKQQALEDRERRLRETYDIIADNDRDFEDQLTALLEIGRDVTDADYAALGRIHEDAYVFDSVIAPANDVEPGDVVPLSTRVCERTADAGSSLRLDDIEAEAPELTDRGGYEARDVNCYLGAPVVVEGEVYGVLCFYGPEAGEDRFTEWQATFVDIMSRWIGTELETRRHTEQLAALNELNGVVRGVSDAVIDQSTREEIEEITCDRLAASESYAAAWLGEPDTERRTVDPRASAGAAETPDGLDIVPDPAATERPEPVAETLQDGAVRTVRNVQPDGDESRQAVADEAGFWSAATVPVVHEDTTYGVLTIYTRREDAFERQERVVLEHLGELVGHAIAAVERKRALMTDEVVELEFAAPNLFAGADGGSIPDGTVSFDRSIPTGDGQFLVYASVEGEAAADLDGVVEAAPLGESITDVESTGDGTYRIRLSEPPLISTIASLGGSVESAVIEDGDFRMCVHVPSGADVRQVIDTVQETVPQAEPLARRQIRRSEGAAGSGFTADLDIDLTDRQRAAVEAAYFAGFFEWPRDSSGEEVAESLDITSPTFHQHVRAAENKVFTALFDG